MLNLCLTVSNQVLEKLRDSFLISDSFISLPHFKFNKITKNTNHNKIWVILMSRETSKGGNLYMIYVPSHPYETTLKELSL